jgi:hypothetical protein
MSADDQAPDMSARLHRAAQLVRFTVQIRCWSCHRLTMVDPDGPSTNHALYPCTHCWKLNYVRLHAHPPTTPPEPEPADDII